MKRYVVTLSEYDDVVGDFVTYKHRVSASSEEDACEQAEEETNGVSLSCKEIQSVKPIAPCQ